MRKVTSQTLSIVVFNHHEDDICFHLKVFFFLSMHDIVNIYKFAPV